MKRCTVCKIQKELSEYYTNKRSADKKMYRCKSCDNLARKKSRANKPEGTMLGYRRRWLKTKFDLTLEQYEEMIQNQENCCAICSTKNPCGSKSESNHLSYFAVDHSHSTGKIRGLLCNACNRGLGFFRDDPNLLKIAKEYLIDNL